MRVSFRQGIVTAPTNFLILNQQGQVSLYADSTGFVTITLADGRTDYLVTETKSVVNAWPGPFVNGSEAYLYWDIDVQTGAKTYGHTTIEPVEGPTPPVSPQNGAHWFDTSTAQMFEYNSTAQRWIHKIRVFAAAVYNGNAIVSMSINSPEFEGTQAGMTVGCSAGSIVYSNSGTPIRHADGTFYTTEDVVSSGIGTSTQVKLESIALSAMAQHPIAAYHMVRLVDYNEIALATNMLVDAGIYGLIETDVNTGEIVTVIREGIVRCEDWDWETEGGTVNSPVFVTSTGEITVVPQPSQPVGIVVAPDSILLTATIVDNISLVESAVTITGPSAGVIVTGATGDLSTSFVISLDDDLAALESLIGTGVAKRTGENSWSVGQIDASTDIASVLPTLNGGTGTPGLPAGYVQSFGGNGSPLFTTPTIDGSAISGNIPGNAFGVTGVVQIENGGTGAITQQGAMNAIAPVQDSSTIGSALMSDGTNVSWGPVATGTVKSVGIVPATAGLSAVNTPITDTGNISLSLTGNALGIANLTSAGVIGRSSAGNITAHTLLSPNNTISILNGNTATDTPITLDLPSITSYGTYVEVIADQFGRVVSGNAFMPWSKLTATPTTVAGYSITDVYTKTEIDTMAWNWNNVTNQPTTLAGYGITDAYTTTQTNALTWNWTSITNTPGTLAGYGILDAVKNAGGTTSLAVGATINKPAPGVFGRLYVDTTLSSFSFDNGGVWTDIGSNGTVMSVTVASGGPGIDVTNGTVTTSGTITVSVKDDLAAIEAISVSGFAARTGTNTWAARSVIGTAGVITVTNGDGVGGNVVLDLPNVVLPGSYYNVIVDAKGRVTSGSSTFAVEWNNITNKPTTVAGFGITDAVTTAQLAVANGVATLDGTGKIPSSQLPPVAITSTFVVDSQAAMLALTAQEGDVAIRTDENKTYILRGGSASVMSNWSQILAPIGGGGGGGVTYVQAQSTSTDITITGGPVLDIGTFTFGLAGNLAKTAAVTGSGILRAGTTWTTGNVNLTTEVTGTLPVSSGGTGATSLTGYVKGNGTNALSTVAKIPATDIDGSIPVDASTIIGVVQISNGGTGATNKTDALNSLLPTQSPGVFISNGVSQSWTTAIPGSYISGSVPSATNALTANNSLALGGVEAAQFVTAAGNNATGTWGIDISGSAARLGGNLPSYYVSTSGIGATGTWGIDISGSAAKLGGIAASGYAKVDGSNVTGSTWSIDITGNAATATLATNATHADSATNADTATNANFATSAATANLATQAGTATNVTGTVAIANGGTGATTVDGAVGALLPVQAGNAGKTLTTNGSTVSWVAPNYKTITHGGITSTGRGTLDFGLGFEVSDNGVASATEVTLNETLTDIIEDGWLGSVSITTVGTIVDGTWNATPIGTAYGGTGLDLTGVTGYLKVVNGVVSALGALNTQQTVATGAYYEYDTWTVFGNGFDARMLTVAVKVLDSEATSPTYNMYINSEAVATVAIKDQRYIRVYNDYTTSLTFYITARA